MYFVDNLLPLYSKLMVNYFPLNLKARTIFEKATKVNYKQVDDLAAVWCEYGEMELRHENYDQALRILRVRDRELPLCHTLPVVL